MKRRGFALLTVLWIVAAAATAALATTLTSRDGVAAAANRIESERAFWRANDCAERARAAADDSLFSARATGEVLQAWRRLDRVIAESPTSNAEGCSVTIEAAGARLDINTAAPTRLETLLRTIGLEDAGEITRRLIAVRQERGMFADLRQLRYVRGLRELAQFDSVLAVEEARVPLNSAPAVVLATIPGFTPEVLARIALDRQDDRPITDVLALAGGVSPAASDSILAHYPEISQITTVNPDAWILTARGGSGSPPMTSTVELKLALGDRRTVVTRRRVRQ